MPTSDDIDHEHPTSAAQSAVTVACLASVTASDGSSG